MHTRRGTFLLFMIAAVALVTVMVFAFLKAVELQRIEGGSMIAPRLAQEAALAGLRHAQEELVRDFTTQAISTLDASGRSSFLALVRPYEHDTNKVDVGDPRILDQVDSAVENRLIAPMWEERIFGFSDYGDSLDRQYDWSLGAGHGRWIEVEFHNRANRVNSNPTVAVPFPWDDGIDLDGPPVPSKGTGTGDQEPGTTTADIVSPIAYDKDWRMLPVASAADARAARRNARYRLRYAVQVRDLDGTLLMNPDPEIDWRAFTKADPSAYGDPAQRRVAQQMHAVLPVISALGRYRNGFGFNNTPAVMQHVFLGRGSGFNFARPPANDPAPMPLSFPLMYRSATAGARVNQFLTGGTAAYPATLYADTVSGVGSEAGMVQLKLTSSDYTRTGHLLSGPQFSYFTLNRCAFPEGSNIADDAGVNPVHLLQSTTPFGRGQDGDGSAARYHGWVSTPWRVNLLTAPPAVLRALVYGYLPPGVCGPLRGFSDLFNRSTSAAFSLYDPPAGTATPDYCLESAKSGSPGYRAPAARYPGQLMFNGYNPDLVADDLGRDIEVSHRLPVLDPYSLTSVASPDPFANVPDEMRIDGTALWPSVDYGTGAENVAAAATRIGPHPDSFWSDILMAFSNAVAIARRGHARYPQTQYDGYKPLGNPIYAHVWDPATDGTADPAVAALVKPTDMAGFDRLFLACLGIDMDSLGGTSYVWRGNLTDPTSDVQLSGNVTLAVKGTPVTTIRALRAASPAFAAKAEVMEMVLNDFRLSFFGSDPAYTASFRPLDFSGDGYATCSAYRVGRAGADTVIHTVANGTAQNSAADGSGRGEWSVAALTQTPGDNQAIVPFCVTGSFFIGRSRYWDVVVRGEVYDNWLKRPLTSATVQSTFVIDPTDQESNGNVGQQYATHVLYQRWFNNRIHSLMARP